MADELSEAAQDLLASIPDTPEWVVVRSTIAEGGPVFRDDGGAVALDDESRFAVVVGDPNASLLRDALAAANPEGAVFCQPDARERLAEILGSPGERADLHTLPERHAPESIRDSSIRCNLLTSVPDDIGDPAIIEEMRTQLSWNIPVSAAFVDGQPVSFCYAAAETEAWWDVSIDTLAAHRKRGHARQAFLHHYEFQSNRGKSPVWGCVVSNDASMNMAASLGFERCAVMWLFERNRKEPGTAPSAPDTAP